MTLDEMNALDRSAFIDKFGWIFEHSPWVAERAWDRRPFESGRALLAAMVDEVRHATREEQLALLRAHPDLGASGRLSAASEQEQRRLGIMQAPPEYHERLRKGSSQYREKFGYPFIFAVRGKTLRDVSVALIRRIGHDPEEELPIALEQVYRIARFRLQDGIS